MKFSPDPRDAGTDGTVEITRQVARTVRGEDGEGTEYRQETAVYATVKLSQLDLYRTGGYVALTGIREATVADHGYQLGDPIEESFKGEVKVIAELSGDNSALGNGDIYVDDLRCLSP